MTSYSRQRGQESSRWSKTELVFVASLAVVLAIFTALVGILFSTLGAHRGSTDPLGFSSRVPVGNYSSVNAQPTPDWKLNTYLLPSRSSLKKVQMMDAAKGWMTAYPQELYRTDNGAKTWQRINIHLPTGTYVTDIFFANTNVGWVSISKTGLDFDSSNGEGTYDDATWIMTTNDSGKNWNQEISLEGAQVNQIHFVKNEGWAVGRKFSKGAPAKDANLILHTMDDGRSWKDISDNLPESGTGVDKLFAISSGRASLLTSNGFLLSTVDEGQTWRRDDAFRDCYDQTVIHRIGITENDLVWLVSGTSGLEGTWSIFAVKEKQGSWIRHEISGVDLADAVFLSEDHVLACGSIFSEGSSSRREAVILYSKDRGKSWIVSYRDERSSSLNSLAAVDSKHIMAVGEQGLVLQITLP